MNKDHHTSRTARRRAGKRSGSHGAALIIVLTFVVLLTVLVVAFLGHSQMSTQIMSARTSETQVDVMSRTAIELTKGDLRQEIIAGSTTPTSSIYLNNGITAFIPAANFTAVPSRTGFTPGTIGSDPMDNIVKISKSGSAFFSGTGPYSASYPSPNFASASSTGTPSLNGRHIDSPTSWTTTGWDKPQLVDTVRYGTNSLNNIPTPDWIYVTSTGRKVLTAPASNVVGRYAFVIYDEGGLLDANVAGSPSSISSPDVRDPQRKGPLALADLTQIPGGSSVSAAGSGTATPTMTGTMVDSLISWRNQATTASGTFSAITNYPSANAPDYLKYVFNGSVNQGFIPVYPGDQKFLSRQDLLAYSLANPGILPPQSLAYLGTFTRGLNAPTWKPANPPGTTFNYTLFTDRAFTSPWTYNVDSANVRWPTTITIIRPKLDADIDPSATTVPTETITFKQGDPVLQHRFPLSKLALLSNPAAQTGNITAPAAGATQGSVAWAVYYYFGLQWVTTDGSLPEPHWEYANAVSGSSLGTPTEIRSIPDVAALHSREPDFFEILRQGVLRGSAQDIMVLEMGASIIDQFDADDNPTCITGSPGTVFREVFGKENIPYLSQILLWPYRPKSDVTRSTFEAYLVPMFWNPHRNASTVSTTVNNFRMTMTPGTGATMPIALISDPTPSGTLPYVSKYGTSGMTSPGTINFITSSTGTIISYQEPTILSLSPAVCSPAGGTGIADATDGRSGFYLGSVTAPDKQTTINAGGSGTGMFDLIQAQVAAYGATGTGTTTSLGTINCVLQYQPTGTTAWYTYENIPISTGTPGAHSWVTTDSAGATPFNSSTGVLGSAVSASPSFSGALASSYYAGISCGPLDPRACGPAGGGGGGIVHTQLFTTRIGSILPGGATWQPLAPETAASPGSALQSTVDNADFGYIPLSDSAHLTSVLVPGAKPDYLGMWNENNTTTVYNYYQDYTFIATGGTAGDRVQRPGDGIYYNPSGTGANPEALPSSTVDYIKDRPIILNRPFRSVGELGYAYRGVEWRTIDFCSGNLSGDAGLLDMFTVGESQKLTPNYSVTSPVQAYYTSALTGGLVNINTHHPEVLAALLSGSLKNDVDSTSPVPASNLISSAQANAIASAIVTETGTSTATHGPLINRSELVTRIMSLSGVTTQLSGTVSKPEREAVVRALAEPTDTRTWNLLVDLDVQVGHYPPSSTTLDQFSVQGERRYWLHLAIDRYTGKVIDEQLEVVNDN